MEFAGVRRQVAQSPVEIPKSKIGGGGVALVDCGGQLLKVLPDVAEQCTLQRAGLLGGAQYADDGVMGGLPGWGEVPQLAPAPKLLEPGHPVGVLSPSDGAPVLELDELLGQMGDVVPHPR